MEVSSNSSFIFNFKKAFMAQFLIKVSLFVSLFLLLIVIGIFLPATPRAATAHLFSQMEKDRLLLETPSPRLLLVGGSNISMSINSQLLLDSLHINPVNTGLSASIGLFYMIDNTLAYLQNGDVVIVCPEYSQFYEHLSIGTEDLLRIILDNSPSLLFSLRGDQLMNSLKYIPRYALSKFKPSEYFIDQQANTNQVYLKSSFNQFGDMNAHWQLSRREFDPLPLMHHASYNDDVLLELLEYKNRVEKMGGRMLITFPALDEKTYDQSVTEIAWLESQIRAAGFSVLGNAQRYRMADSLLFDTPHHLIQPGVDWRTQLLIEDIKTSDKLSL